MRARTALLLLGMAGAGAWAWLASTRLEFWRLAAADREAAVAVERERLAQVRGELAGVMRERDAMGKLIRARAELEEQARRDRQQRVAAALAPLPEGVRLTLAALGDCLAASGHGGLRFMRASAVVDGELREVEVLDVSAQIGGGATLYLAERVGFVLDRAAATLTITFRGGRMVQGEERTDLGEVGRELRLAGVDCRQLEARLPHLVVATGDYPAAEPVLPPSARLDAYSLARWRQRLDALLAAAATPLRYSVHDLAGLDDDACFREVLLLGCGAGGVLEESIEAERCWVAVDAAAGLVELVLQGGRLRRRGGEVPLPEAGGGHRLLLSGVDVAEASRLLAGMVVGR